MASGIYRIRVERGYKTPRFYVGQAVDLMRRRREHFNKLRHGSHKSPPLQRAFLKYGEEAFSFHILIVCEPVVSILEMYELAIINSYAFGDLYNMCLQSVGSRLGVKMSDATKAKIGAGNRGKVISDDHKAILRKAQLGRKHSAETIQKRILHMVGNKFSLGCKRSPEEIARRTATLKYNKQVKKLAFVLEAI